MAEEHERARPTWMTADVPTGNLILLLKSCLRGFKVSPDGFLQVWMKNLKDKPRLWLNLQHQFGWWVQNNVGLLSLSCRWWTDDPVIPPRTVYLGYAQELGGMFNQNFIFYNAASDGHRRDAPEPSRWLRC